MSKRQHPVSQVLKLIEGLDDNERQIVRDFLRAPRAKSSKSATAQPAGRKSSKKPMAPSPAASTTTDGNDALSVASAVAGGD